MRRLSLLASSSLIYSRLLSSKDYKPCTAHLLANQVIEQATEWTIMHGVAFRQTNNSARHCPFSIAPMTMKRKIFEQRVKVTQVISKQINHVSEDHDFLQTSLQDVAKADPFFNRQLALNQQAHGDIGTRIQPALKPQLLMRTDYMDDRKLGAKVVEFNSYAGCFIRNKPASENEGSIHSG